MVKQNLSLKVTYKGSWYLRVKDAMGTVQIDLV